MPVRRPLLERLVEKIEVDDDTGCFLFTGARTKQGYGNIKTGVGRINAVAHRVVYEHFVGPIPDGLELDHLCRVKHCVNPDHIEAVTHRINMLRGETIVARQAAQTHCGRGHLLSGVNAHIDARGKRKCRKCEADRASKKYWASRNQPRAYDAA